MKFKAHFRQWLFASALASPPSILAAEAAASARLRGGTAAASNARNNVAAAAAPPSSSRDPPRHRELVPAKAAECTLQVLSLLEISPGALGDDEVQLECTMDASDANGKSNQNRRIHGSKNQMTTLRKMFDDGDILPNQSKLSLGSDVGVGKRDLVLPNGFDPKSRVERGNGGSNKNKGGGNSGKGRANKTGRRLARNPVVGDKPTLVVKVFDVNGLSRVETPAQIGDDVFGTLGDPNNLASQMNACSMGKLTIVPGEDGEVVADELYAAPGVVNVTIPLDMTAASNGDVRNAVTSEVESLLQVTLPGPYQQVLYVLEGCYNDCGWAAYAYIDSWNSVYQGGYYKATGVLMHELGHNFNLAHSGGLNGATYTDHTGMMGNPLYGDDNGRMCFNAAKNWQLPWYEDRKLLLSPLAEADDWTTSVTMVGIADYLNNPQERAVVIKLETNTGQDFFVGFNRATGVNEFNDEADDEVTVVQVTQRDGEGYAQSYLKATLTQGESYEMDLGGGKVVYVDASTIDIGADPGYATVTFRTDQVPTASPTPKPPQCSGSDPATCGCDSVLQDDYRGTISTATDNGIDYTCQAWSSQSPHTHSRTSDNYPDKGLEENYCRNPDGESRAWCYTTDPGKRWAYCDVPHCTPKPTGQPTPSPTDAPTVPMPTKAPTPPPTNDPTNSPTPQPTPDPTPLPTPQPPQCEGANPATCGCDSVLQADYRGTISTTPNPAGGTYTCQAWDSQSPHGHTRTHANFPGKGLEGGHNYCRNPDGEPGGAWCYTTDPSKRWVYCTDVPSCVPPTDPTEQPTPSPTPEPTTLKPTNAPTPEPTNNPTNEPTPKPTNAPTPQPTKNPTNEPTVKPTIASTPQPTDLPTNEPTLQPSNAPTPKPTIITSSPTNPLTKNPTPQPTPDPTPLPTPQPGQCEGANPATCGCDSVLQADYRGTISTTPNPAGGTYTCQAWDSQSPHGHTRTYANFPGKGLEGGHNYCRNPDGEPGGAWCYTTDPSTRWVYCTDVPSCVPPAEPTTPPPTSAPTPEPTNIPTNVPSSPPPTKAPTPQATNAPTDEPLPVCSTPELTSFESLTSDRRSAFQNMGLPTITGGTSTLFQGACQTDRARQRVLMVGIDGLRADVVGMTPLPALRRLQAMGTYSFWADVQSTESAVSGPGWSSMFTGVQPSKHLVGGNGDLTDIAYPTVFKMVKDTFGMSIAASVSWHPLVTQIIDHEDASTLDDRFLASDDQAMAQKAEEWILGEQYDFVFVDFDGPDAAGHSTGFDGYASVYQERVRTTDALLGNLLDAVLGTSSGEEWLIVVTSDHGGEGTSHGAEDVYNRKIPFLVASNSPRVGIGYMPFEDPGSHMDVLPTIMHFLGGPGAVPDGLDGQVFGFNDYARRAPTPAPTPTPCVPDPANCGCASVKQADYRGTLSVTESGLECQPWADQTPHSHSNTPGNNPNSGLVSNYCRNPDGEPGAWCYTVDSNVRWELCSVPTCGTESSII